MTVLEAIMHARRWVRWIVPLGLAAGLAAGCTSTMKMEAGRLFEPKRLATSLTPGVSTPQDVVAVLGPPFGKGETMMPYHDGPRTTWTYFLDRGAVDFSSHRLNEELSYLFVFFKDSRVDGYIWFDTTVQ